MPLMDAALLEAAGFHDVNYGVCDNCEYGSLYNANRAVYLRAQDDDDCAPWLCETCYEESRESSYNEDEDESDHDSAAENEAERYSFETDYAPQPPPRLLLPVLENRAARMVSIEQEVGMGGRLICQRLYDAGFAVSANRLGYHAGDDGGFCRVEDDASVDSEIIYGKLRLDDANVARRLEDALHVVRDSIAKGESKLDMRCGLHVHVDARGMGMRHVESLYHLWNHVEDVVFCLASANWSAHRSEVADHNYAPRTIKGLETRPDIGSHLENNRGALNVSNYLASRGYCRCGAFTFEAWETCTCDLRKATVEFRVFNATASLRKIHAYTALCLALTEAARSGEYNSYTHHANEFTGTASVGSRWVKVSREEALRLIFEDLPLTGEERADLAYCARNSCLADLFAEMYAGRYDEVAGEQIALLA